MAVSLCHNENKDVRLSPKAAASGTASAANVNLVFVVTDGGSVSHGFDVFSTSSASSGPGQDDSGSPDICICPNSSSVCFGVVIAVLSCLEKGQRRSTDSMRKAAERG